MCANIGVDPLASNKGVWAKTLGIGDFYFELGVQVGQYMWAVQMLRYRSPHLSRPPPSRAACSLGAPPPHSLVPSVLPPDYRGLLGDA